MDDFGHTWPNQGGLGHAEEVYCSDVGCGAGDVETVGQGATRLVAEGVTRASPPKADADGPNWTDVEIAEAFDSRTRTVEFIRERLVTEGFEIALNGQPKSRVRGKVLNGEDHSA